MQQCHPLMCCNATPLACCRLTWRSSFPLTSEEQRYVEAVLQHRESLLLTGSETFDEELTPLPAATFPERLRPKDGRVSRWNHRMRMVPICARGV
jgi:hypothetical protein